MLRGHSDIDRIERTVGRDLQLLAAAARIVQALGEDPLDVDVCDDQVFGKRASARDDDSPFIDDHAVAVEDQFILPAEQVAVGKRDCVVFGARAQHSFAVEDLAARDKAKMRC